MSTPLKVEILKNGSLEENCYFLRLDASDQGILIDPGEEFDKLDAFVSQSGAKPVMVIATHGHWDHVGQVAAFQKKYGAAFAMHPDDHELLEVLVDTFAFNGLGKVEKPKPDQDLSNGQLLQVAGMTLKVFHTPGHSPGGVCIYHQESGTLFSGDTLFRNSIGRADFPGSSPEALENSIRQKLYTLPDETIVYPGHGPGTTIGEEKSSNPFVRA